ncbi:hypothetical protein [Labrenzia sp. OB1]|uniref:hypothetical protein n=1 Tax=Labrenzia sp. OB1 TaxID=1561204 RepID=UPI0012E79157|nr:hypothetical protein [Labrenzia sp. OB1]
MSADEGPFYKDPRVSEDVNPIARVFKSLFLSDFWSDPAEARRSSFPPEPMKDITVYESCNLAVRSKHLFQFGNNSFDCQKNG